MPTGTKFNVYVEVGSRRSFAGALDWPGWCRSGRTGSEALAALLEYGPKYASILSGSRLGFAAPTDLAQLVVVERLQGNATTDFGAIGIAPEVDRNRSCSPAEVRRFEQILRAAWRAFDRTVDAARGRTLATGPRGGGRSLEAIVAHLMESDRGYLAAVGGKAPKATGPGEQLRAMREAILAALRASAGGEIPAVGPRGGSRWTARFFVRRLAWHVIAHVWEIERRAGLANS